MYVTHARTNTHAHSAQDAHNEYTIWQVAHWSKLSGDVCVRGRGDKGEKRRKRSVSFALSLAEYKDGTAEGVGNENFALCRHSNTRGVGRTGWSLELPNQRPVQSED